MIRNNAPQQHVSAPELGQRAPPARDQASVKLADGKLVIQGTAGADKISVNKDASGNVVVKSGDQVLGSFPADEVKSIHVHGHRGKDDIKVDVGEDIKVRVRGGRGGDNIEVDGAKDAFIRGGRGNDTIALNDSVGGLVRGGRGTDAVSLNNTSGAEVHTGRGKDDVNVKGSDNSIATGMGDDQVGVDGQGNIVLTKHGNDVVIQTAASGDNTVNTGMGDDEQIMNADALPSFRAQQSITGQWTGADMTMPRA